MFLIKNILGKITRGKRLPLFLVLAVFSLIVIYILPGPLHSMGNAPGPAEVESGVEQDVAVSPRNKPVSFERDVRPVLERRCVVCHGCYDAPCQLKLSSIEGMQRGASKERIYEPKRISVMQPTRLFIDAKSTAQWRSRGFSPVLN
ncbi:MAG: hypothetical protein GXP17_01475, partial [Gammaproteobacteria bacterium]|nr:hypothetical protein [Gammaproteobacteria bacterium]